jgi:hypothetical protein
MLLRNKCPLEIEWNPPQIFYLERFLFLLQICTNIISILLFILWQLFLIFVPPFWFFGIPFWIIYFIVSARYLNNNVHKKWEIYEKILVAIGVLINLTILILMIASKTEHNPSLKDFIIVFVYLAPTITIISIIARIKLHSRFSSGNVQQKASAPREDSNTPDWTKL